MFDGVFLHNLVNELKVIENERINKVNSINDNDLFLTLSSKNKLFISLNSNTIHMRLSKLEMSTSNTYTNFHRTLKKHLESSIIQEVLQYNNDRIAIIKVKSYDDLGYCIPLKLIIEFFGRNRNMILCDDNDAIIDCFKRCFDSEKDNRIILPKSKYQFPISDKINPYSSTTSIIDNYEGVSSILKNEILNTNINFINIKPNPVIIKTDKKKYYYCFDLPSLIGTRTFFDSISNMLENYYIIDKNDETQSNDQIFLKNYVNHEIEKTNNKIIKQNIELTNAQNNLIYEKIGNLLSCNLYNIKKGMNSITVIDYYDNNKPLSIELDPLLYPNDNLENAFNKYHKAKRAIEKIKEQIEISKKDLEYFKCLLNQVNISKISDLLEIYDELEIKVKNQTKQKKNKPNILIFNTYNDDTIWVGKNNIQNNYLTNHLAHNSDYFFHVQGVPGSHVILRTENLTEELINLVGTIAAYYSTYRFSSNVCVDYTLIKNVKKIPKMKGSFVTYSKYKSVFAKPDLDFIKNKTKK